MPPNWQFIYNMRWGSGGVVTFFPSVTKRKVLSMDSTKISEVKVDEMMLSEDNEQLAVRQLQVGFVIGQAHLGELQVGVLRLDQTQLARVLRIQGAAAMKIQIKQPCTNGRGPYFRTYPLKFGRKDTTKGKIKKRKMRKNKGERGVIERKGKVKG